MITRIAHGITTRRAPVVWACSKREYLLYRWEALSVIFAPSPIDCLKHYRYFCYSPSELCSAGGLLLHWKMHTWMSSSSSYLSRLRHGLYL